MRHVDASEVRYYSDDEIDLFELVAQLWEGRWWLVLAMFIAVGSALVYLQFTQPVYESRAALLSPTNSSIAVLNVGRVGRLENAQTTRFSLEAITAKHVYDIFLRHLNSGTNKRTFFEEVYAAREELELDALEQREYESEYKRFLNRLTIVPPSRNERVDYYQVVFNYSDPELASNWVEAYLQLAADRSLAEIISNINAELNAGIQTLSLQKSTLIEGAKQTRSDAMARLREALFIAKSVGITEPLVLVGREQNAERGVAFHEQNMLYLRGSHALAAELSVLKERKNVEPFVDGLRELEAELDYLKQLQPSAEGVAVYTLDEAASAPQTPIKPRKSIVLLVAAMLGGFVGVGGVLLKNAVSSYRRNGVE